jgi:hypothetical protein
MASGQDDFEPPRAILNNKDRKMLGKMKRGEDFTTGLTDEARWKRYSRIRKRLRWAIYDFGYIYQNWEELNLDKVFDNDELSMAGAADGLEGAIETLYRGLYDKQISFEHYIEGGIYVAERDLHDRVVDVRLSIEPEEFPITTLKNVSERVTPEDVNTIRVPEGRAILEALAHSDADIPELVEKGNQKRLRRERED